MLRFLLISLAALLTVSVGHRFSLTKESTIYLPSYDAGDNPIYEYDNGAVEQIAYDPQEKIIYSVGSSIFHAIDVSNPKNMTVLYHRVYPNTDLTDIEFCGGYVFFAADNQTTVESRMNGALYVLKKYQKGSSQSLRQLHKIPVGAVPDMIKPTKDCKTVLVAVEAEAFGAGNEFRDPLGGVDIIRFPNGVENDNTFTQVNFTEFNSKVSELETHGVRFVYRQNGNTFDRDVEPEYISYNYDESVAYIGLQENNAIATVDLQTSTVSAILGLGYKSWKSIKFDASDKDGGINMKTFDIRSHYLPDAIHFDNWKGKDIVVMANEGDAKDYEKLNGFNEEIRGSKLAANVSSQVPNAVRNALADNDELGRLFFSKVDGLSADGIKYDNLYAFGGRSMTIRLASDMSVLYDSGSVIEEQLAEHHKDIFNSNGGSGKSSPRDKMDTRSDNKGPECESLTTAKLGDRLVIFVGNERPGTISVFSVADDFSSTRYEFTYSGIPTFNLSFNEMYRQSTVSEIDPEDIRYVPASESPTGDPVLLVAGSVSGTISILKINVLDENNVDHIIGSKYFTVILFLVSYAAVGIL